MEARAIIKERAPKKMPSKKQKRFLFIFLFQCFILILFALLALVLFSQRYNNFFLVKMGFVEYHVERVVWSHDNANMLLLLDTPPGTLTAQLWLVSSDFSQSRKIFITHEGFSDNVAFCFSRKDESIYYSVPDYNQGVSGSIKKTIVDYDENVPTEEFGTGPLPSWFRYLLEIEDGHLLFIPWFETDLFTQNTVYQYFRRKVDPVWQTNANNWITPLFFDVSHQDALSSGAIYLRVHEYQSPEESLYSISLSEIIPNEAFSAKADKCHIKYMRYFCFQEKTASPLHWGVQLPDGEKIGPIAKSSDQIAIDRNEAVWIALEDNYLMHMGNDGQKHRITKLSFDGSEKIVAWNQDLGHALISQVDLLLQISLESRSIINTIEVSKYFR